LSESQEAISIYLHKNKMTTKVYNLQVELVADADRRRDMSLIEEMVKVSLGSLIIESIVLKVDMKEKKVRNNGNIFY